MNYMFSSIVIIFVVSVLVEKSVQEDVTEWGKLKCTENGIFPDDTLLGIVMKKCQPKMGSDKDMQIACITKCMMKQMKAVNKKGKLKKEEAKKLADLVPDDFKEASHTKFDECFKEHESKIKKESKCDSWLPFSKCFISFAESICKTPTTAAP